MEQIVNFVSPQNRAWVKSMTLKDVGAMLDILATIPARKTDDTSVFDVLETVCPKEKNSSAYIGKVGEDAFETAVHKFLPSEYKIANMSKKGKSGDFKLSWTSTKTNKVYSVLVDVKKYSSTVPSKEIDKFHRDINVNKVDGGMLLSLTSKICGVSKIIDFRDHLSDTGATMPALFTVSNSPLVITEVIQLLFHVIEAKDICRNDFKSFDGLYAQINQLNETVQLIIDCRDTLQMSKTSMENSMNEIMRKLMGCEYNLVSKINDINKSLVKEYNLTKTNIEFDEPSEQSVTMIRTVIDSFGSSMNPDSIPFLYQIFDIGWDSSLVELTKRTWVLQKGDVSVKIKINKKCNKLIFSTLTDAIQNILANTPHKKNKCVEVEINSDTINSVVRICAAL